MLKQYALSVKQPWAALLAHGLKTIEVRNWPTARRGRVLLHAAQVPDPRPEAARWVPSHLKDAVRLSGAAQRSGARAPEVIRRAACRRAGQAWQRLPFATPSAAN